MTPEKVRIPSIQCPRCDFNNPDASATCFGCGEALAGDAVHRLITVRRRRHSVEAISLADLQALRTRVRALSEELCTRKAQLRTGRLRTVTDGRPVLSERRLAPTAPLARSDEAPHDA